MLPLEEYIERHYLPLLYKILCLRLIHLHPEKVQDKDSKNFSKHIIDYYTPEEIKEVYDMYRLLEM